MDKVIRWIAFLANVGLIIVTGFILSKTYGLRDGLLASLLAVPPLVSLIALYIGPDIEERRLMKQVNKARLRAELEKLEKK